MRKATVAFYDFTDVEVSSHLHYLFDRVRGYVVVAVLDRDRKTSPQHKIGPTQRYFQWPAEEIEITEYVVRNQSKPWHEVWVCPYPFRTPDRAAGNSSARYVVHADADKPFDPTPLVNMGFRIVCSGTPGHAQVYAKLTRSLTHSEHRIIEDALRKRLNADAKISDNDYLKIPGGTNYKNHPYVPDDKRNDQPYPVTVANNGRIVNLNQLIKWLGVDITKANVPTPRDRSGWTRVQVPMRGRPPWVQQLPFESTDGDRSKKCYAAINGCREHGYTDDQVHTLLDEYPPGVDKYGARWHDEINRVLGQDKTTDVVRFDTVDQFWQRRDILRHIHAVAISSYAGPWGTLGVALLRALHVVPPRVVLPDLGGGIRSLNLFVAMVARSGGGKDTAIRAGTNAIDVGAIVKPLNLGSGEGISKAYRFRDRTGSVGVKTNAIVFDAGEISTWNALLTRTGSTLHGELLKGFAGGGLGFQNADDTKTIPVDADSYRMGLLVSAQPAKCSVLFGESASGLPQRFLYLPLGNPDHPDDVDTTPAPFMWEPPEFAGDAEVVIGVCDTVRNELRERNRLRVREELHEDPLDSHWPVVRLRVAVTLALLDGRLTVDDDDWDLAGIVMNVSRMCRDGIVAEMKHERVRANVRRGEEEAERALAGRAVIDADTADKCAERVAAVLKSSREPVAGAELRRRLKATLRPALADALTRLVSEGTVRRKSVTYRGQSGYVYWIPRD